MKIIEEIKQKFKNVFFSQEFHINIFGKTLNDKMTDFKIEENEIKMINDFVINIMKQQFKELINKELEDN